MHLERHQRSGGWLGHTLRGARGSPLARNPLLAAEVTHFFHVQDNLRLTPEHTVRAAAGRKSERVSRDT